MYGEKEQLKKDLQEIKENNYFLLDKQKISDFLPLMLKYIGDTDAELRDSLIYLILMHWIEEREYFTSEELNDLLGTLISNDYLFYGIGKEADDSVFKRSFSVLLINPIICFHLNKPFLNIDSILKIKECLIRYFREEVDLRGYDADKGWAHALAHASDSINVLLLCNGITEEICKEILLTIESKLLEGKCLLDAEEDERIINIIYYRFIDDKLLDYNIICDWINGLEKVLEIGDKTTRFAARVNLKNLIRSLYFRLQHLNDVSQISSTILNLDRKLNFYLD